MCHSEHALRVLTETKVPYTTSLRSLMMQAHNVHNATCLRNHKVEEVVAEHGEANALGKLLCCVIQAGIRLLLGSCFVHPMAQCHKHCTTASRQLRRQAPFKQMPGLPTHQCLRILQQLSTCEDKCLPSVKQRCET